MPDKSTKWPRNKPGKFYVDETCIACDACVTAAPENFIIDEDEGHAYVNTQPRDETEEEQCQEAMEGCPVEAIGNDGQES